MRIAGIAVPPAGPPIFAAYPQSMENTGTRINKFLGDAGFCSRREADRLVEQGLVRVNGGPAHMGLRVFPSDRVEVSGQVVAGRKSLEGGTQKEGWVYLAFHKPPGIVCTTDRREPDNVLDFIDFPERIYPIGRLDKMSEGLLLLTNDGSIVNDVLRARHHQEKEYEVWVNRPYDPAFLQTLATGVDILDTRTRPCYVEPIDDRAFRIVLTQGLNRQIRRMCEALGYHVVRLRRIRIKDIHLDVPKGKWRPLEPVEVQSLRVEHQPGL
jgi:pseudouridine synthase